ncbi:hypothetical protein IK110_02370 [Candidatus Saccharibacteria bacterium]|nr:hypothetical protein [Candidatus Saccharibacteria bacterium]
MDEDLLVFLVLGFVFAGIGIILLLTKIVGRIKAKTNCTERVMATCVRLEKMSDNPDLDPEERKEIEQEEAEERQAQIEIMATSTPDSVSPDDNGQVHPLAPVYKISINGFEHEVRSRTYSFPCTIKVGDMREIYINPNKPTDYYDPKEGGAGYLIEIIAAFGFVAMGSLLVLISLGVIG